MKLHVAREKTIFGVKFSDRYYFKGIGNKDKWKDSKKYGVVRKRILKEISDV